MYPYSVTCPYCGRVFGYQQSQAGQIVPCLVCGRPLQLPPAGPTGSSAAPVDSFGFVAGAADERVRLSNEPWYYGFLEGYTRVAMWLGIIAVMLAAIGLFVTYVGGMVAARGERAGVGGIVLTVFVVGYVLWLAAILLAILFQAALVLLAVDAARNLRKLVALTRQSR